MTTQKPQQPKAQSDFLDQLYNDIRDTVIKVDPVYRTEKWGLIDDLFRTVIPHIKQSYKNGIETGKRQGGQSPRYSKKDRDRAGEKQRQNG